MNRDKLTFWSIGYQRHLDCVLVRERKNAPRSKVAACPQNSWGPARMAKRLYAAGAYERPEILKRPSIRQNVDSRASTTLVGVPMGLVAELPSAVRQHDGGPGPVRFESRQHLIIHQVDRG